MSVQDKVERVLREIHILISKGETFEQDSQKVIVDKKQAITLLNQLTVCMSEMMEAYEVISSSRDRGEREARRKGEDIIRDANHTAEDIYAASVMYTDEALTRIQNIMEDAGNQLEDIFQNLRNEMKTRQKVVRENQRELKSSLEDLKDTDKYMRLIEERNKQLQKKKEPKSDKKQRTPLTEVTAFPAGKPEIKINPEYFEKIGKPLELVTEEPEVTPEQKAAQEMEIKVNLDAEYFRWKEEQKKQAKG